MSRQEPHLELGRRERQIMDVLFRLGRASVSQVREQLADPPTYSAVRGMLRFLEDKGFVKHEGEGIRYMYSPAMAPGKARSSALRHMLKTFFDGSPANAVAALLEMPDAKLTEDDVERLTRLIERTKAEGR
jgi:predicted transcriptional regulator